MKKLNQSLFHNFTETHAAQTPNYRPKSIHDFTKVRQEIRTVIDLEVEVGSTVEETPNRVRTFIKSCDSSRYKKLENTKLESHNREPNLEFIMKLNETSSNLIKNISEDTKVRPKKKICQKSRATITSRHNHLNISQRSSKLKVLVHKSVSAGSLTRPTLTSTKATNASVPCDPDHLMVKILDTDPSLSDSCLMRTKKFKNSVQKACSCLNDILQQLNDTEIKESSSNCKIQPSNIDLELQRPKMHKFRFFFPRLPSNRDVHNVDKGQVNIESCGSSNTQEAQCQENSEASVCRIPERRQVTFYSPCSNISLSEERNKPTKTVKFEDKVESKVEMKVEGKSDTKVSENEVHLIDLAQEW